VIPGISTTFLPELSKYKVGLYPAISEPTGKLVLCLRQFELKREKMHYE